MVCYLSHTHTHTYFGTAYNFVSNEDLVKHSFCSPYCLLRKIKTSIALTSFGPPCLFPSPVICCVHVSADSYLSVHAHPAMEARELLRIVAVKTERGEEDMVLVVSSDTGGEASC